MNVSDSLNIIKKHGLKNGLRRIKDEFYENYLFDLLNKTSTREIIVKKDYKRLFYKNNINLINKRHYEEGGGDKWYQPTYQTPLLKCLEFLKKDILSFKKREVIFIDLGCGKGKPNYIFSKFFPQVDSLGVDLFIYYKKFFTNNLKLVTKNFIFLNQKAENLNLSLLSDKKLIILHNKNSFSYINLKKILEKFLRLNSKIIFIYNNPFFHKKIIKLKHLKKSKMNIKFIFSTEGWHKNFKSYIYSFEKFS
jgi:tRNA G46 methylase TrmB